MTTATDTELDQRTRDDLQPPCEIATVATWFGIVTEVVERCDKPADKIVRVTCPCGPGVHLICTPHSTDVGTCQHCRARLHITSVEPI